jgi:hypothetical protein
MMSENHPELAISGIPAGAKSRLSPNDRLRTLGKPATVSGIDVALWECDR